MPAILPTLADIFPLPPFDPPPPRPPPPFLGVSMGMVEELEGSKCMGFMALEGCGHCICCASLQELECSGEVMFHREDYGGG